MKIRVGLTPFGAVAIDKQGNVVKKLEFPNDAKEAAKRLIDREKLIGEFTKDMKDFSFDLPLEKAVEALGKEKELDRFSREVARELIVFQMRVKVKRDMLIIQAIKALDDLNISINSLFIRLQEWYGLHFPELAQEVDDHEEYVRMVRLGKRDKINAYKKLADGSMGMAIEDVDIEAMMKLAERIEALYAERKELEAHLEALMKVVAPNVSSLAGAALGARLIAKAGSLEKLAFYPSSTIQLLGAEKALFKHIVSGSLTPKHGLIFQHPSISFSPKEKRGKVARALASKLALSARVDYFSHKEDTELKKGFDERFEAIKEGA